MPIHPAERIRQRLFQIVAAKQALPDDSIVQETTLIRGGMYCGRRFYLEGYSAVFFAEEQQIKFYHPDGSLNCKCSLHEFCNDGQSLESTQDQRRAA